jgi:hypothetical protein
MLNRDWKTNTYGSRNIKPMRKKARIGKKRYGKNKRSKNKKIKNGITSPSYSIPFLTCV